MLTGTSDFASSWAVSICWFTAYYFTERCLRGAVYYHNPRFYEKLQTSRKDLVFFAIAMGILITALSTPFCAYAALDAYSDESQTTSESHDLWQLDFSRKQWSLGLHARVCVAARSVSWISSLHRMDMYSLSVLHHSGAILALLSWLHFRWPNLIFLTLFTMLVSEIPGDVIFLVTAFRETMGNATPKLDWFKTRLTRFNAIQYTLVRGGGLWAVCRMLWLNKPGVQDRPVAEQLYAYSLLGLYSASYTSFLLRQFITRRRVAPVPPRRETPEEKVNLPR